MTLLYGTHFTNGYAVARTVFYGIFLVALAGIAVWSVGVKRKQKNRDVVRAVLGWSRWGMAIVFVIIYYAYSFAESIIYEDRVVVYNIFFVSETILYSTAFVADIFLLLTIYTLLYHCFMRSGDDPKLKVKRSIFAAHCILCAILGALYIAYLALNIRDVVQIVEDDGSTFELQFRFYGTISTQTKIEVSYKALYFAASIEILLATVWVLVTASKHNIPRKVIYCSKVNHDLPLTTLQIGFTLIGLIGFPLFLCMIIVLSYTAAFEMSFDNELTNGGALAELIIVGFASVAVYAGVVLVAKQLGDSTRKPWEAGQQAGFGPVMAGAPQHSPQQYPPQHHPPQPYPSQQHPPQPYPSQQYPPQPYPPQPYPPQPYLPQQYSPLQRPLQQYPYGFKGPGDPRSRTSESPIGHNR
ncbi:MAG: hypothetical protein Q9217_006612 [Psora testacea]